MTKSAFEFRSDQNITKADEYKQIVYGWASVIEENGKALVDKQGDVIMIDELENAAHGFISNARTAKVMHEGTQKGEIVESLVFSHELQKALGIDLKKVGWFIGMKIFDKGVFQKVLSGELKMFSIGGRAEREEIG